MRDARACGWQIVNSEWRTARTKSNQRSQVNKRTALNKLLFALGSWSALLFALTFSADAQQPKKIPRIGFIAGVGPERPNVEAFRQGLRDLGYLEGKNLLVEYRYIEGKLDQVPGFVTELMQLKVDVLVVGVLPAIRAAKQATKTIPIVMVTLQDPVTTGIVDSLAHPGGNITGLTTLSRDLSAKRLELLKEVVPAMSVVGVLWDPNAGGPTIAFKEYEAGVRRLKIQLQSLEVRGPEPDFQSVFQAAAKGRADAFITVAGVLLTRYRKRIVELAIKNRLPSMHEQIDFVEAGGLVSYAANEADNYKRAAIYVDKILKGTKPADLPVEQPTKFELVINLKTAKALNLTIPQSVLFRADRVIK
jgi:putative ABC transport system substrate-binding protein